MKLPISVGLMALSFLVILGLGLLRAQNEFDPLGENVPNQNYEKQIRIQVEWIEVSHELSTELMGKNRRTRTEGKLSSNDQPLRDELAELIKKGEAKIADTTSVIARSGNRAKAESVQEFIYPTEYERPRTALDDTENNKTQPVATPPTPTAFEVRNIGTTLEVDPVLGADNFTIDLNLAPELVYNTGFESYGTHKDGDSSTEVKMPKFFMAKVTTQVTIRDGEPLLLSLQSPRDIETGEPDPNRKLMVFVRADIIHVGLPLEKK